MTNAMWWRILACLLWASSAWGQNDSTQRELSRAIELHQSGHYAEAIAGYRAFLKVSNGWRFPSVSIFDLLPADKVAWFREQNQNWIDAFANPPADLPPISDKEYLVYGPK